RLLDVRDDAKRSDRRALRPDFHPRQVRGDDSLAVAVEPDRPAGCVEPRGGERAQGGPGGFAWLLERAAACLVLVQPFFGLSDLLTVATAFAPALPHKCSIQRGVPGLLEAARARRRPARTARRAPRPSREWCSRPRFARRRAPDAGRRTACRRRGGCRRSG